MPGLLFSTTQPKGSEILLVIPSPTYQKGCPHITDAPVLINSRGQGLQLSQMRCQIGVKGVIMLQLDLSFEPHNPMCCVVSKL